MRSLAGHGGLLVGREQGFAGQDRQRGFPSGRLQH